MSPEWRFRIARNTHSESNSTEVNCEEWCLKELDLQDWESEEEQERAQAELEESWCSTEQEWQENLFNSEDLLRIDWYRLQSMLEQQMVVGTKYEDRPVNIAKLTDGEKVFLVCKQPLSAASRAAFPGQSGPY